MSLAKKILSNTFWQVFGRLSVAVLGIISIKVITNYLPTDIYGQYTTLYEYIGFFAIAADFGLYTIGVREMAKKEKPMSEILANVLSIRIVLIILTLISGGLIAQFIPQYGNTLIPKGIWIVAMSTALVLLHGTLSSVLQYKLKMLFANISLVIGKALTVAYIIFTIFYLFPNNIETGFNHLLYAGIIGNIAMLILTVYFVSRYSKIYLDFNWKYTRELVIKALPLGLALVLSTIYFKIDVILIGLIRNYHETGIYGVPLKFMEILVTIPVFFMNSALPAITEAFHKNKENFVNLIKRSWDFLILIAVPLLIGGILLAFPLTFAISNPQFLSGYHCTNDIRVVEQNPQKAEQTCAAISPSKNFTWNTEVKANNIYLTGSDIALKIILIAMFFAFLNTLFAFTLVAMEKQSHLLLINFIGVIFNIATNIILIPKYGFQGAAITTVLSEIIILLGTYISVRKQVEFKLQISRTIKTILAGLVMGIAIYLLQPITFTYFENFNLLLLIPIGAIIYLGGLYVLKAFDHEEIRRIFKQS